MKSTGSLTLRNGRDSAAPAEALSTTGLSGAVARLEMAMASTPNRKAERMMAPRLPGSTCGGMISRVWGVGNGTFHRTGGKRTYYSSQ